MRFNFFIFYKKKEKNKKKLRTMVRLVPIAHNDISKSGHAAGRLVCRIQRYFRTDKGAAPRWMLNIKQQAFELAISSAVGAACDTQVGTFQCMLHCILYVRHELRRRFGIDICGNVVTAPVDRPSGNTTEYRTFFLENPSISHHYFIFFRKKI